MARSRREIFASQKRPTLGQMMGAVLRQKDAIDIYLEVGYQKLYGFANPEVLQRNNGFPLHHSIYWQGEYWCTVSYNETGWAASRPIDQQILEAVGCFLIAWYR